MAIWAGIAGGAAAYGKQQDQLQEEQRWLERYKQTQNLQAQADRAKERYIAALSPPKTDSLHTTDEAGKPIVQNREWIAPSDADIAAGRGGSFKVTGSTPDINFERLNETAAHNAAMEAEAQKRLELTGQLNAARIDAANARGAAGGNGFSFNDYATADPQKRALYDRYRRGEDDPSVKTSQMEKEEAEKRDFEARKNTKKDLENFTKDPTEAQRATALYNNQVLMKADPFASVKAGGGTNAPMAQFSGGKPAASHGRVVRTGTKNGRRVVQYEDGTVDYAQ